MYMEEFDMVNRNDKKSKFIQPRKSNTKTFILAGVLILAVIVAGGFLMAGKSADAGADLTNVGPADYTNQTADFVKVQATETGGDIVVDLNELKSKKLLTFDIPGISFTLNNGTPFNYLPILAYVSPKGNVVVAASLCEPCSGIYFHVEGNELVCNACGTRWDLETLQGISGGCPQYPPDKVKYTVDGDKLIIKKADLAEWKPRAI